MLLGIQQSRCAKHENTECNKSLKLKRRCRRGSGCSRVRAVVAYQAVQQMSLPTLVADAAGEVAVSSFELRAIKMDGLLMSSFCDAASAG